MSETSVDINPKTEEKSKTCEKRKLEDNEDTKTPKDTKKRKLNLHMLEPKKQGFSDKCYSETSYYFENRLRKVYPYYFTFTSFTKGRWVGETIYNVFAREFRAQSAEDYERRIKSGTLTVNYEKVTPDYKLQHNDLLSNVVHRHEVPVTDQPITIIHMDDDIVAVNKPSSIPVHPCGRYRHNTIIFILAKDHNLKDLKPIHRLDRLTSGLLIFGRSLKKAQKLMEQVRNRELSKDYVCRVEGEFPDEVIECNEPIECISHKVGFCKVDPKGKECLTLFQKLSYNGKTSVVLCKPITGRMHQIRVHLQFLGYPIVNDPLYNLEIFGPLKGKGGDLGGKTDEQLIKDLLEVHNTEIWLGDTDTGLGGTLEQTSTLESSTSAQENTSDCQNVEISDNSNSFDPSKVTADEHCYECKVKFKDPKPQDLVMYLHALKYSGPDFEFETEMPDWAKEDWLDSDVSK